MKTPYATLAPNLYLLKLNRLALPYFVFSFFTSEYGNKQLKKNDASSTLGALYKNDVKAIEIALPTIEEQRVIIQILSDMDAEIAGLEQKLVKYKLVKQGMMQELLTGKTRLV